VESSLFAGRRRRVAEGLKEKALDSLLVAFSPNLRYLSGFTGSSGMMIVTSERSILITDPRYQIQAAEESECEVRVAKGPLVMDALKAIAELGLRRIGFEPARMTCDAHEAIKLRLPMRSALEPVTGWIEELRMVKSPEELALIRRSVAINSQAFERAVSRLKAGASERDLAAELEYRMRRLGAEKPSFETIVAAGARSALPHAQPTSARLTPGDLVVVDMGAFHEGYASDMTRMLSVGPPRPKAKRLYRAVLEAQLAALDRVRAGVSTASVDRAARRVLARHGFDRYFIHSTGHGLGLEIHEPPRLGKRDKMKLTEGMAVTVEPGAYLEGFGGVRIEDTVVVTKHGCEILTPTSKELRVV
jgi:Xaa-Pro aminopeptidase